MRKHLIPFTNFQEHQNLTRLMKAQIVIKASARGRAHLLKAGRGVSIATGEIRKEKRNNRERWMKEQVRDEARTIDQSVEGVQGMGGG